jgi:hypothetical protein
MGPSVGKHRNKAIEYNQIMEEFKLMQLYRMKFSISWYCLDILWRDCGKITKYFIQNSRCAGQIQSSNFWHLQIT